MKNLEFNKNNNADFDSLDIDKTLSKINETFQSIAKDYSEIVIPKISDSFAQCFKVLAQQLRDVALSIDTDLIVKQFQQALDNIYLSYQTSNDESKEIEFTDEQLTVIENLNINIDDYANRNRSTKNRKFFTPANILAIISMLITIILAFKPNADATLNNQQMQEIVEIKNSVDETNDLLQSILEQLGESTCDEAEH